MPVRTSMSYPLLSIILKTNFINLISHILFMFCSVYSCVHYNFEVSCVSEGLHVGIHKSYFVSLLVCWLYKLPIVFLFPLMQEISLFSKCNVPDCNPLHLLFTGYRKTRPELRRPLRVANQLNNLLLRLRLSGDRQVLTHVTSFRPAVILSVTNYVYVLSECGWVWEVCVLRSYVDGCADIS